MSVSKCPVCYGSGLVPPGFYDPQPRAGGWYITVPLREMCRACAGRGVIVESPPVNKKRVKP